MATKLEAVPETGAILIAHHDSEALVITRANEAGLPYMLTRWMPLGVVYRINCDSIYAPLWERMP